MNKLEYRSVIKFLTLEGETPKNVHERMTKVYGVTCPSYTTVKNWARDVCFGKEQNRSEPCSGWPSTAVTDESIQAVVDIIMEDRRITLDEIAHILGISYERVHHIIHQDLEISNVCADWVPRMLRGHEKKHSRSDG
jgi:hypothetical protein